MSNNEGMLSQEEIDALLGNSGSSNAQEESGAPQSVDEILTPIERDAIGEIGNISFGSAATALSTLLNQKVEITTPIVTVIRKTDFKDEFPYPHVSVHVEYTEGFKGSNVLLIREEDASIIADLMLGGEGKSSLEINEIHLSAVQEAMNQMMGSSATSMSMLFDKKIDISPPMIEILNVQADKGTENIPDEDYFAKVSFKLRVGELIDSNIMQLMPIDFCKELVASMVMNDDVAENFIHANTNDHSVPESGATKPEATEQHMESHNQGQPINAYAAGEPHHESGMAARSNNRIQERPTVNVQPAAFADFNTSENGYSAPNNIDLLLDIPLNITVELGQTKKTIKDILDLSPGSVIELDKLAGEPVDVLVNNRPIAKGEVVVIDENFGVRITEIINKRDRLEKLN